MRLIIAGSRSITDYEIVRQAVIDSGYWKEFGRSIEVVCGMAKGVDLLGKEFAERNGLIVHKFPAKWRVDGVYNPGAGHIRNAEMGRFALEDNGRLLALWDGESRGTKQMIEWAKKNGLESYTYLVKK